MKKYCIGCGELINPKRVEILPNTKTCTDCSTAGIKRSVTIMHGNVEKDDTWIETLFVDEDEYNFHQKSTGRSNNRID